MKTNYTAKTFIEEKYPNHHVNESAAKVFMVEFARIKVRAAVRAIARGMYDRASEEDIDFHTNRMLKDFYPLEKIKSE